MPVELPKQHAAIAARRKCSGGRTTFITAVPSAAPMRTYTMGSSSIGQPVPNQSLSKGHGLELEFCGQSNIFEKSMQGMSMCMEILATPFDTSPTRIPFRPRMTPLREVR